MSHGNLSGEQQPFFAVLTAAAAATIFIANGVTPNFERFDVSHCFSIGSCLGLETAMNAGLLKARK